MINSAPKAACRQSATKRSHSGRSTSMPAPAKAPTPTVEPPRITASTEIDRPLETEIARLDIDVVMRKQRASDGRNGRAESESPDLDQGRVEADKTGRGLIVMHGAHLQPQMRPLEQQDRQQNAGGPCPDIAECDMLHAVIAAGAAHRREHEKKTPHHLAEAESGDGEINALEPQGRESDDDTDDARRQRRRPAA